MISRENREKILGITYDEEIEGFPRELLDFYDEKGRPLPWREEVTPYRTWVSEIMLQQTRATAVIPYFLRFVEELPHVAALAQCDQERLMKLWEGLGYYSRVRNMQKAAIEIMENHGGELPGKKKELIKLSGIGEYTSGAIASIAFGEPVVAVDGNILRIMSRVLAMRGDIKKGEVKKALSGAVEERISPDRPGDFNQAMMDLGATVCIPRGAPLCHACPISHYCEAYIRDEVELYPEFFPKKMRRIENKTVLLISSGEDRGLRRRGPRGVLAGMWEFPTLDGHLGEDHVKEYMEGLGYPVLHIEGGPESRHIFTHIQWEMISYRIRVPGVLRETGEEEAPLIFVSPKEMAEQYALPSAYARYK